MASEMVKLLDGATTTTALAIKAGATALPTKADGYRSLAGRSVCAVRLKFGATRSAGDNETFAYQIYLWRRRGDLVTVASATLYDPEEIARGVCTIGTKTYTDGGVTHYEVDTITNTITACPNVYVHSRGDDRSAWIYVDCPEVLGVQVIPDRDAGGGTAVATCDVWIQELSEADSLPFELLADLKARIGAGYSADGGADVGDSVYADMQEFMKYDAWRPIAKLVANPAANANLFTITGVVQIKMVGSISVDVAGAGGNASIGDTDLATRYMGAVVNTTLDAGTVWIANNAVALVVAAEATVHTVYGVAAHTNTVILTVGDTWAGGGSLQVDAMWRPVSVGATVVSA